MDFDAALALAQEKGFAERDPAADIEGHDACRKICILASLGFGKHVYPEQVKTEGITNVTLDDAEYADKFNCVIKLIGSAKKLPNGKITAFVRPTVVSRECILASVNGVFNAIMVNGDETGEVMFYGKGAGKRPTASAVVADVMDCVKHINARKYLSWEDGSPDYVDNSVEEKQKFYVRIKAQNYQLLKSEFIRVFGENTFFIGNEFSKELVFISDVTDENELKMRLDSLKGVCGLTIFHTLF